MQKSGVEPRQRVFEALPRDRDAQPGLGIPRRGPNSIGCGCQENGSSSVTCGRQACPLTGASPLVAWSPITASCAPHSAWLWRSGR